MSLMLIKEKPRRPSVGDQAEKFVERSHIVLRHKAIAFMMELHGEIADIPNIKNGKALWGGIAPRTMAWLHAVDHLFEQAGGRKIVPFNGEPLSLLLVCAVREHSFDPIGCAESIQDWLEPPTKNIGRGQKRSRGWGCGLVADDNQIVSWALKSGVHCPAQEWSTVILRTWNGVHEKAAHFMAEHFL